MTPVHRLIDEKAVVSLVTYSHQHIRRLEKAGRFPRRIRIGKARVAWLAAEIQDWIAARVAESRG